MSQAPVGRTVVKYLLAAAFILCVAGIRAALSPLLGDAAPLVLFLIPVSLAAWLGGFGPGLLATVLGVVLGIVLFAPVHHGMPPHATAVGLVIRGLPFVCVGTSISLLAAGLEAARGRALANERAARSAAEAVAWLSAVVASSEDAIISQTLDGTILTWNGGAERLFGYPAAEMVGRPTTVLYPPDRLAEDSRNLAHLRAAQQVASFETVRVRKDGTPVDVSVTVSPVRDATGRVTGVSKIVRDVTARRRAEAGLTAVVRQRDALLDLQRAVTAAATGQGTEAAVLSTAADRVLAVLPQAQGSAVEILEPAGPDGEEHLVYRAASGSLQPFVGLRVRRGGSLSGRCVTEGRVQVCDDCETDPWVDRAACRRTGLRSMVVVPIPGGGGAGSFVGVLKLASAVPSAFGEADVLAAQLAVGAVATGLSEVAEARAVRDLRRTEARYRDLFVSIDAGFCVIEVLFDDGPADDGPATRRPVDYRFLEVNPAFARQTDMHDAAGRRMREFAPDLEPYWFDIYGRVATTGRAERFEREAKPLGRWFDVYAFPTGEPGANQVAILFNDVTERRRTELALRHSEQRLQLAVRGGRMGTWDLDLSTGRLDCSDACKANYGRDPGRPFTYDDLTACIVDEDRPAWRAAVDRAATNDGGDLDVEYRVRWPADGSVHWVRVRGSRDGMAGDGGGRVTLSGVSFDITAQKAADAERAALLVSEREARAEAERQGRLKDEFLATLSHELRTPLNGILGWAQLLRHSPGAPGTLPAPEDLTEGLEAIEQSARAQAQIVNDLLEMSRAIAGKVRLDVRPVDVAAVVRAGADTVRPAADAKGVELQITADPAAAAAATVAGDASRLQQVFWNLLSNAVKFTPTGGRVAARVTRFEGHVAVSVTDTGEGIDPAFLPFVFDRFRQADGSTTRRHGGLGLGLSIVKQLVELHGGRVRAESGGVGRGATFTVELPLTPTLAAAAATERDRPQPTAHHSGTDRLAGLDVLVVDDDTGARALVKRLLADRGAAVRTAGSAAEAFDLLTARPPAVLVSDIGMPGEDGYGLIRRVRALPPAHGGGVPALALTAYAAPADRARALAAGFQAHAAKPVDPAELTAAVATLAARSG